MNTRITTIQQAIEPLRAAIIHHKVYAAIQTIDDLKIFMEHHVYAVWDFMSLLKSLQNNLTCTTVPWFPTPDPITRQLINEIVLGEESDEDAEGHKKSHYELYLDAMAQSDANTKEILAFTSELQTSNSFPKAYALANTPLAVQSFVNYTFKIAQGSKTHTQAAVFTFGREDLIPNMFHAIVNDIFQNQPEKMSIFKYYLERHIELDGDHHSHLALQMTENICGDDDQKWKEAETAVLQSLQCRIDLWDAVYEKIQLQKVQ